MNTSKELLALFSRAPGFLCFLQGPDHVFALANDAYTALVGDAKIVGKTAWEALPRAHRRTYGELIHRCYTFNEQLVRRAVRLELEPNGPEPIAETCIDLVLQPILTRDGIVDGVLLQGHEVTDADEELERQKAVETRLQVSEQRYRALLQVVESGFCLLEMIVDDVGRTIDYRFLETNDAFDRLIGPADAAGRTARELSPCLDPGWLRIYGRVASSGAPARFETYAGHHGGCFAVHATRVGDPAQRRVAVLFKDITSQRFAERERSALLARERAARRDAEDAARLRDEFLAVLGHELRTPLHAIVGWTQLMRADDLHAGTRARALDTIERNARIQGQIIDDLLDLGRIVSGKLRIDRALVDVSTLVAEAVDALQPTAVARNIGLHLAVSPRCYVMGDARRLHQAVSNLLTNALKFTSKGGRVVATVEQRSGHVVVVVDDDGCGIPPEFLPTAFDRFAQAAGTHEAQGLGLGLAIVRHIVEHHDGYVVASSEGEGRGSTFTIVLVAAEAPQTAEIPAHRTPLWMTSS